MIRTPAVAGMFYPAEKNRLQKEIKSYLDAVEKPEKEITDISAIIVPHAGYVYSGLTAAYAYKLIENKNYENVIILSPSHREYFPGVSIYNGDAYQTPLGNVEINVALRDKLTGEHKSIFKGEVGHREEHAVEVQLPFLQTVLSDFKIIPVVIGDQRKMFIYELAEKLAGIMDEKTLLVTSTDLSHYHSKVEADRLDSSIEIRMINFDHEGLQFDLELQNCEACGGGGIVAAMKACQLINKNNIEILKRSDSGDVNGSTREVVGYLSAVIYG